MRPGHITLLLLCGEQRRRMRRMNSQKTNLAIIAMLSVSVALAEDLKTVYGKEYKNTDEHDSAGIAPKRHAVTPARCRSDVLDLRPSITVPAPRIAINDAVCRRETPGRSS